MATAQTTPSVQLTLDTSEAEQALQILDKEAAHQAVNPEDWQRLFATTPYQWLKDREAAMGREFTDETFKHFLLQPETLSKRAEWHDTLTNLEKANMAALGANVLTWLPPGATIHARVFPEIKPVHNSFVWAKQGESPAIFLYLEKQSQDKFENTVAHECHHIGLASLEKQQDAIQAGLPLNVKKAMEWIGGFGEGEAMLAAAGSADRHPHWEDDGVARARWDADMMHFNVDLQSIQQLLMDILDGKLTPDTEIRKRAAPFWGEIQGGWYTVGYEMASLVEKQYGRSALNECLLDPRKLLVFYNQIAEQADANGATLATWTPQLIAKLNSQN
ncbi:DUF5700 domain-containing putative Zn-dependent protease [Tunturibacter empetritectus]|uniref:DUF5700 domain-containing putative Zn-dependent protease n=1 Tax=Tunturiibacter empetritectus TaxID=3069691 RepID=A0AAU7ZFV0_9BACT